MSVAQNPATVARGVSEIKARLAPTSANFHTAARIAEAITAFTVLAPSTPSGFDIVADCSAAARAVPGSSPAASEAIRKKPRASSSAPAGSRRRRTAIAVTIATAVTR